MPITTHPAWGVFWNQAAARRMSQVHGRAERKTGEVVNAKPVPHIPRQEGERGTARQGREQQDTG